MERTSTNSIIIPANIKTIYNAFIDKEALEYWLTPDGMTGKIHSFEFKVGGKYEMSLFYKETEIEGKTSGNEDRYSATFTEIIANKKIVQAINFQSENNEFKEEMIMEVHLEAVDKNSTKVIIIFKNIPIGIDPKDNQDGTEQSLKKLAKYVERN
ncbi:SRPBCC domain-containing protein [Pedobacter frigiditerrae]|uniref:SRPBCC domain-containing protein n=1 Tax=Pedobacter frigiditerrae TaxID=2530452 RepID=UPI00292DA05D|nr:SRPBCC domain-containing protein [Pedobacter frigiditerrae]